MDKLNYNYDYSSCIKDAAYKLKNNEIEESYKLILNALMINPDTPEPQNLLGIWYELKGNTELARKHYRASCALDPSYIPANKNLERVCMYFMSKGRSISFGDEAL